MLWNIKSRQSIYEQLHTDGVSCRYLLLYLACMNKNVSPVINALIFLLATFSEA